jgi:hypothetical protein
MALHIYPLNDTKEHDIETTMCKCWPEIKLEDGELLIIHKSFDGREHKELNDIESWGCENRIVYKGDDIAKNSMVYYNYINGTKFTIEQTLDIRLLYMNQLKEFEITGKEDLGMESDVCRKEIAGCDLILKLLSA